jgi:tricorn protease
MWRAEDGSFSPDGTRIAYVPNQVWQTAWKRYRGGQTTPVWIARLADLALERIPRADSNDTHPVWLGDKVYFLSDRNGPVTLFVYDPQSRQVTQVVANSGFDFKSLAAGPDALVYEQFGSIHLFLPGEKPKKVDIRVASDLPDTRPYYLKAADKIASAAISPSGARAAFEAHGEILTVPAEKGDIRNLTRTTDAAERDPAWSPDGRWIAFFSDQSGEYMLHLSEPSGTGAVRRIPLGEPPSFFYRPLWSPDSRKIAYQDKRLNLWMVDIDKGVPQKVDSDRFEEPLPGFDPAWSPDSRWLAYSKLLPSHLRAIFVHSLETGINRQLTDGMSDARFPAFDKAGGVLFFAASTDLALSVGWLDLSSYQHPVTRSVYALVLKRGQPSPLAPESDEEKVAEPPAPTDRNAKAENKKEEPVKVGIDFERLSQRILPLPVRAANYVALAAGKAGILYLVEQPLLPPSGEPPALTVSRFDLPARKTEPFLSDVAAFLVSANGEKVLYRQGPDAWFMTAAATAPKVGEGALKLDALEVYVDPRPEWKQMYREVWRIQRDFFYDPAHHGLDLQATEKRYEPFLEKLGGRADLNYLFDEMLGELTVGHMFIAGGALPEAKRVQGGFLGADIRVENGRYRFTRVYDGESWNPELRAPLTQPGVDVQSGEYLLEVDGREVRPPADVYSFLENTAGRQLRLKVGSRPDGTGAREVTVVPLASEFALRNRAWEEDCRRRVDELSGGRLAYVHLPDTDVGGLTNFNRYYFAQVGKQGAILDDRFNHGGQIADYFIDLLDRPLRLGTTTREGADFYSPLAQIYGPKTMIINEMAGSGGDALPWMFHAENLGPLVGRRTWGGLVGIYSYPALIDGGSVTSPRAAIYGLHGDWEVENRGIAPDIEVENDPASVAAGRDPQLEKAVEVTLAALEKNPSRLPQRPPYPDYHKK